MSIRTVVRVAVLGPTIGAGALIASACATSRAETEEASSAPPAGVAPPPSESAAGDPANGARLAQQLCASCHTFDAGGRHGVGPSLHGVYGRRAGSAAGFNFSPAMREAALTWDARSLDRWLEEPRSLVPKTSMNSAGVPDAGDRRDIIAFLATDASQ